MELGRFATPKSFDEIQAIIENASTPADATIAVMMTLNLAHAVVEQAIEEATE